MPVSMYLMLSALLLTHAGEADKNRWKSEVRAAVERADERKTAAAYRDALDVTWRADDWRAGLSLAEAALEKHGDDANLRGMVVRALWRAGHVVQAEKLAERIARDTDDRVAARTMIDLSLARGKEEQASQWAAQLEKLGPQTADDFHHLFTTRFALDKLDDAVPLLRKIEKLTSAQNGYPEIYFAEMIEGVAEFLAGAGPQPLNQITHYGWAPMTALPLINLPSCEVRINGHGPYRMVLDTGGSIMLALDQSVADELGLKSIASGSVRGVSGKQETGQVLIDELTIGGATCRRVMTRTFDVRAAVMGSADGIIGTGIFADGRMTLDFAGGRIELAASSDKAGAGSPVELRLVGDAKLMALVRVQGEPTVALLDTGADVVAMAPSRLKQLFPDREIRHVSLGIGIGIGADETPAITLNPGVTLDIGARQFERTGGVGLDVLDDTLGPILGLQADMLVGMPVFREMRSVTVDFRAAKMWVDWLARE